MAEKMMRPWTRRDAAEARAGQPPVPDSPRYNEMTWFDRLDEGPPVKRDKVVKIKVGWIVRLITRAIRAGRTRR